MLIEKLIKFDQQVEEFINHYAELGFANPDEMTKKGLQLLSEIKKLTVKEQLQIIEKTAKTIQLDAKKEQMRKAADQLHDDYRDDAELTVFTDLDLKDFYEAR